MLHHHATTTVYVKLPCDFNEVYRILLSCIEQEINNIKWTYVFSGNKTDFVRPGHI